LIVAQKMSVFPLFCGALFPSESESKKSPKPWALFFFQAGDF
jgi:hypothetical protein